MFDFEKLILEVEPRPCLWDVSSSDYHDKHMKSLEWNSIAAILYSDWENLSISQKEERGNLLENTIF